LRHPAELQVYELCSPATALTCDGHKVL